MGPEAQVVTTAGEPEVSVLMCIYNGERYLDESMASIREQTLRDIEIILVDDGSTDETPRMLARYAAEDPRIRLLHADHEGPAGARNVGLAEARGRYVALMDADDIAHPDRLTLQFAFMRQNPDVVALGTSAWHIGPRGRRLSVSDAGPASRQELQRMRAAHEAVFLITPTVMLDRDTLRAAGGFRPEMVPAEDIDMWTRLAEHHTILSLRDRLLQYRIHGRSISTSRFFEQMHRFALVQENADRRHAGLVGARTRRVRGPAAPRPVVAAGQPQPRRPRPLPLPGGGSAGGRRRPGGRGTLGRGAGLCARDHRSPARTATAARRQAAGLRTVTGPSGASRRGSRGLRGPSVPCDRDRAGGWRS